jgi:predicted DNA-binding transcriptional regulator AlpA
MEKILDWAALRRIIPLSRSHIWRLERAGNFPARIKIGNRRIGWRASEVEQWIDNCRPSSPTAGEDGNG